MALNGANMEDPLCNVEDRRTKGNENPLPSSGADTNALGLLPLSGVAHPAIVRNAFVSPITAPISKTRHATSPASPSPRQPDLYLRSSVVSSHPVAVSAAAFSVLSPPARKQPDAVVLAGTKACPARNAQGSAPRSHPFAAAGVAKPAVVMERSKSAAAGKTAGVGKKAAVTVVRGGPRRKARTLADRFELGFRVGHGAFGSVFAAWDLVDRRPVAVKVALDEARMLRSAAGLPVPKLVINSTNFDSLNLSGFSSPRLDQRRTGCSDAALAAPKFQAVKVESNESAAKPNDIPCESSATTSDVKVLDPACAPVRGEGLSRCKEGTADSGTVGSPARPQLELQAGVGPPPTAREEGMCSEIVARGSAGDGTVVELLGAFVKPDPRGDQICLVMELLGPTILDLIKDQGNKGLPVPLVARLSRDMLRGLDRLHRRGGLVHTDIKPENILLRCNVDGSHCDPKCAHPFGNGLREGSEMPKKCKLVTGWSNALCSENGQSVAGRAARACIVDLGNSCYIGKPFTMDVQTIEYRSPEVILQSGYGPPADIWSLGCLIFEMLTGEYLFDPKEPRNENGQSIPREEDLLAQHMELLGLFPKEILGVGRRWSTFFCGNGGRLRHVSKLKFWELPAVLRQKYGFKMDIAAPAANFLQSMLHLNPACRSTARELLKHSWLPTSA